MESREVVGWGTKNASWASVESTSVSKLIANALYDFGVRESFGVLGGGICGFAAGLVQTPIRFYHCRHEAGAGFAAMESYAATGRPALVLVTTGPGLFNVLNSAMAARIEGTKLLLVSGFTSRTQTGKGAVQETSTLSMPADLLRPSTIFHDVAIPETLEEVLHFLNRTARGFSSAKGYVAHLGLSLTLQTQLLDRQVEVLLPKASANNNKPTLEVIDICLKNLSNPDATIWVGHGAQSASCSLRKFAQAAQLPVICTPRGKGIFPESDPLFVGISGAGCDPKVFDYFNEHKPKNVLIVGTRLNEVSSFLNPLFQPKEGWVHVDIDESAFGAAYTNDPSLCAVADAHAFFEALFDRAQETGWFHLRVPRVFTTKWANQTLAPTHSLVRPAYLMQEIQHQVVENSDALVMCEAGTSFTWCCALLKFDSPHRFRTSPAWGSMGHFTTGCLGSSLSTGKKTVAVVGDGAMLMNNEINTAVQYNADILWIVLNDAQLGLNQHGMTALGMQAIETQMPLTDFVTFAQSQGADGALVQSELELSQALTTALAQKGPFVLDVRIDKNIPSPIVAMRVKSLRTQSHSNGESQ